MRTEAGISIGGASRASTVEGRGVADSYSFTAPLWEWPSRANWFFVSVPKEHSEDIADRPLPPRGFGSVRVRVHVGATSWTTSIFPDSDGTYSLPIKSQVRRKRGIEPGEEIGAELDVQIELLD
ncbi:DUF1905 domain-containing protein [Naasia lichenicola]|uniref:DUF1905 domain-containing protein n=1 Tax=Naasia lichenicola TaxID=2565933 RepID=A0A4S4FGK0_9MICO|nr:DUF1905 domain-containing protein [Naasia lichenicola]THG29379.1 DUF1905 domain-containing protein [Naasia lichenicola]